MNLKKQPTIILVLSFFIPILFLTIYSAMRGMAPFGSSSILTVDMGQQYVTFFAYFQNTILHNPSQLFYSFSKGFGGETLSTWAYYLMSPLNWLLLLFRGNSITSGILLITILKFGFSGLSFAYMSLKSRLNSTYSIIAFSIAYALMGFAINNELNLIWADAFILLPLIILGLQNLILNSKSVLFIVAMAALVIINYYFAYMVALFTVLYLILFINKKNYLAVLSRYFKAWILIIGISAWVWMPTLWSLLQSKAQYTETSLTNWIQFFPLDIASKFFPGAFSFHEMSAGLPNIYFGMLGLIAFAAFFFSNNFSNNQKIRVGIISFILLISTILSPLDLVWHAMQFPWWYPYRFSFLISFWVLYISQQSWQYQHLTDTKLFNISIISIFAILLGWSIYRLPKTSDFMNSNQLILGTIFFVTALLLWNTHLSNPEFKNVLEVLVVIVTAFEMFTNLALSLDKISYVSQSEFSEYSSALTTNIKELKQKTTGWYRTGTNYYRTKDDPMQFGYFGGSHFNSTLETNMINLASNLGQPTTSGNIAYTNGTLVSDALFGYKYWSINNRAVADKNPLPTISVRQDLQKYYQPQFLNKVTTTFKNPYALTLGSASSAAITAVYDDNPLIYQSELLSAISGKKYPYFTQLNNYRVTYSNLNLPPRLNGAILKKQDLSKPASFEINLAGNINPIYMLNESTLNNDNVDIFVNGHRITQNTDFEKEIVYSVSSDAQPTTIKYVLKNNSLVINNIDFYQLHVKQFKAAIKTIAQHQLNLRQFNQSSLTGTIVTTKKQPDLFTSIPYSAGWKLTVDGASSKTSIVGQYLLGAKLKPGKHTIELKYVPPYLLPGILVSCLTLLSIILLILLPRLRKNR